MYLHLLSINLNVSTQEVPKEHNTLEKNNTLRTIMAVRKK
jgi:hypothetical protein